MEYKPSIGRWRRSLEPTARWDVWAREIPPQGMDQNSVSAPVVICFLVGELDLWHALCAKRDGLHAHGGPGPRGHEEVEEVEGAVGGEPGEGIAQPESRGDHRPDQGGQGVAEPVEGPSGGERLGRREQRRGNRQPQRQAIEKKYVDVNLPKYPPWCSDFFALLPARFCTSENAMERKREDDTCPKIFQICG